MKPISFPINKEMAITIAFACRMQIKALNVNQPNDSVKQDVALYQEIIEAMETIQKYYNLAEQVENNGN